MMKQVMKSLVVVGAMLVAGSAAANIDEVKPSIGVDFLQAYMKGQNSVTVSGRTVNVSDLVAKSYPGATVYLGAKFMENLGAEVGYDLSSNKKRTTTVGTTSFSARVKRTGWHLDLVGFLPMNDCSNLFASLGAGWVKAKMSDVSGTTGAVVTSITASSKMKTVWRLGVGANYMLTEMFGVRAKVGFEGTSALRNNVNNTGDKKYFKDSTTVAVGAFAQF